MLNNLKRKQVRDEGFEAGPILLTCYTNHALDQFLEKVMGKTKRIVRLGGMTKNENLKKFSIREVSKKSDIKWPRRIYNFFDQHRELKK